MLVLWKETIYCVSANNVYLIAVCAFNYVDFIFFNYILNFYLLWMLFYNPMVENLAEYIYQPEK